MGKSHGLFHKKHRGIRITFLMNRDGQACTICGVQLDRHIKDNKSREYISFDHIVPRSHGGDSELKNLRLAHQGCNWERGNDPLIEDEDLL
jgi:5-methylcytosine-specific restriction endonuclease McrA